MNDSYKSSLLWHLINELFKGKVNVNKKQIESHFNPDFRVKFVENKSQPEWEFISETERNQ